MTRRVGAPILILLLAGASLAQDPPPAGGHFTGRWPKPPRAIRAWLERSAKAKEGVAPIAPGRARRIMAGTARTLVDPRFASAIVLADLARAGTRRDSDRARDALRNLDTYEFWTGVAEFNVAMRTGDAIAARLTSRLPASGAAGAVTGFLKHNLVLAGAMTVSRVVEVDFGGKRLSDLADGELPDLSQIRVRFKGKVDAGDLAITLGSFAIAQPLWSQVRAQLLRLVKLPTGKWAKRSGSVIDLAAILIIAHELEEPAREVYERWLSTKALREAVESLNALMERTQGDPPQKELEAALGDVARAFANHRDFLYLLPAVADAELIHRLEGRGETRARLAALEVLVLEEHGEWLALPGQTLMLLEAYRESLAGKKVPGGDLGAFEGLLRRHLARLQPLVRRVIDAQRLPPERLTGETVLSSLAANPTLERSIAERHGSLEAYANSTVRQVESGFDATAPRFQPSHNRMELYAQELAYYRLLHLQAQGPALRSRLLAEAAAIGSLMAVEQEILDKILAFKLPASGMSGALDLDGDDR